MKKPLRAQIMGTILVSIPVGDHGTSVKVCKRGWAAESNERAKRSPEREFREPHCPDPPTQRRRGTGPGSLETLEKVGDCLY